MHFPFTASRHPLSAISWAGLILAACSGFTGATFCQETARREFRRVDLGNGLWRVEVVPETSPVTERELEQENLIATDLQITKWMLEEARLCLAREDLNRADQLIKWATSMEFDWDRQQAETEQLLTDLRALELQLNYATLAARSADTMASRPGFGNAAQQALPQTVRDLQAIDAGETPGASDLLNALREPEAIIPVPPVGTEPTADDTKTRGSVSTSNSETTNRRPDSSAPPVVVERESVSGTNSLVLPLHSELFVVLVIVAICGLLLAIVFACLLYLLLRRMAIDDAALRIAVEESTRRQLGRATEDSRSTTPGVATDVEESAPAELKQVSPAADSAIAPVAWADTETFADQKKKAELQQREQESAIVQQILTRNAAIRKRQHARQSA